MEAIRTYERYLHITDNVEEIASVLFNVGKTYDGIGDSIKADGYYRRILNMESLLMKYLTIIGEFDNLNIQSLFGSDLFGFFSDFSVRPGQRSKLDRLLSRG